MSDRELQNLRDEVAWLREKIAGLDARPASVMLPPGMLVGKTTGGIAKGMTGTLNIYRAGVYTTGDDLTVLAELGRVPPNSKTYIAYIDNQWRAVATENCS